MSVSNEFASAREGAARYVSALIARLGGRDPLEVQAELPERLAEALAGVDDRVLRTPEAPGKWSIVEVVQHLADSEIVYGYRMRKIAAEPGCAITGFDQDRWTRELRYNEVDLEGAVAALTAMRAANLRFLRARTADELERHGVHGERGNESVWRIAQLLAAHDLNHLDQIRRIRVALAG